MEQNSYTKNTGKKYRKIVFQLRHYYRAALLFMQRYERTYASLPRCK